MLPLLALRQRYRAEGRTAGTDCDTVQVSSEQILSALLWVSTFVLLGYSVIAIFFFFTPEAH